MKLLKLSILDRTETHIIAELEYSVSTFFGGEKRIKRKVHKKLNDAFSVYWWFMDTGDVVSDYDSLNAILSTNENKYYI